MDSDAIVTRRRARSAALAALITVAMSSCEAKDTVPTRSEAPVANAHPTKFVRVRGHIDPSLSMLIATQYASSSPQCRRTMNWIEGVVSPVIAWHHEAVHRLGDQYEATVAFDGYEPGRCDWYPLLIGFLIRRQDGVATGLFKGTDQVTKHIDGPQSTVWLEIPGKSEFTDPANKAFRSLAPFAIVCREVLERGAKGLWCEDPEAQRHPVPLITDEATEINVDVQDYALQKAATKSESGHD